MTDSYEARARATDKEVKELLCSIGKETDLVSKCMKLRGRHGVRCEPAVFLAFFQLASRQLRRDFFKDLALTSDIDSTPLSCDALKRLRINNMVIGTQRFRLDYGSTTDEFWCLLHNIPWGQDLPHPNSVHSFQHLYREIFRALEENIDHDTACLWVTKYRRYLALTHWVLPIPQDGRFKRESEHENGWVLRSFYNQRLLEAYDNKEIQKNKNQDYPTNLGPMWYNRFWTLGDDPKPMPGEPCIDDALIRGGLEQLEKRINDLCEDDHNGDLYNMHNDADELDEHLFELLKYNYTDRLAKVATKLQLQHSQGGPATKRQLEALRKQPHNLDLLNRRGIYRIAINLGVQGVQTNTAKYRLINMIQKHKNYKPWVENRNAEMLECLRGMDPKERSGSRKRRIDDSSTGQAPTVEKNVRTDRGLRPVKVSFDKDADSHGATTRDSSTYAAVAVAAVAGEQGEQPVRHSCKTTGLIQKDSLVQEALDKRPMADKAAIYAGLELLRTDATSSRDLANLCYYLDCREPLAVAEACRRLRKPNAQWSDTVDIIKMLRRNLVDFPSLVRASEYLVVDATPTSKRCDILKGLAKINPSRRELVAHLVLEKSPELIDVYGAIKRERVATQPVWQRTSRAPTACLDDQLLALGVPADAILQPETHLASRAVYSGQYSSTLKFYNLGATTALLWSVGSRVGQVFDLIRMPDPVTIDAWLPSVAAFKGDIAERMREFAPPGQHWWNFDRPRHAALLGHMYGMYFGALEGPGLNVLRLCSAELNELLLEIDKMGIKQWLNAFAQKEGIPHVSYSVGCWDGYDVRWKDGLFKVIDEGPNFNEILLAHGTYSCVMDGIIAARAIASANRVEELGLPKLAGESGRHRGSYTPRDVSFYQFDSNRHKVRPFGGYGELPGGFDYPMTWCIVRPTTATLDLHDGSMGSEKVVRNELSLKYIDLVVVPPFAISDMRRLLDMHRLHHIDVQPLMTKTYSRW